MTKMERGSLAGLPLSKKTLQHVDDEVEVEPEVAAAAEVEAEAATATEPVEDEGPKPTDRVVLMLRVSRFHRKKMRQIAAAQDTTVQALAEEAIKDIVRRNRVRPI